MSALGRPRSIAGEHALVIFKLRGVTDAPDAIRMRGAALMSLTTAGQAQRRRVSGAGSAAMAMTTTGQAVLLPWTLASASWNDGGLWVDHAIWSD